MTVLKKTYCCKKCRSRHDYSIECGNSERTPPISARRQPQMTADGLIHNEECLCFTCTDERKYKMCLCE